MLCEGNDVFEYDEMRLFTRELGRCSLVHLGVSEVISGGRAARFGFEVEPVVREGDLEGDEVDGTVAMSSESFRSKVVPSRSLLEGSYAIFCFISDCRGCSIQGASQRGTLSAENCSTVEVKGYSLAQTTELSWHGFVSDTGRQMFKTGMVYAWGRLRGSRL